MKFNHLNVPSHWQQYWTRYPEGYTILEALINWVSQVDDMVDNQNALNKTVEDFRKELDDFVKTFDPKLQEKVIDTLYEWQQSGFLDVVIDQALQTQIDDVSTQVEETDKLRRKESLINRKEPDGLYICWIDDDGRAEVYDRMLPLMLDYGIPMTSSIIPDRVLNSTSGMYLTPSQIKELSSAGMEFLSHTNSWDSSDRPIDWTEERLDEDFRLSQQQVKQLGGNPRGLVLPYADNSDLIQKVARRYYDFVVGTGALGNPVAGKVLYPGEIDNYYITRVSVEQDFNYVKQRLDEGAANGVAWVNLVSHIFGDWYSDAYCRQIISYARSLGYKFITTQEGVERFGNIAQFGDTKIGADGTINSDTLGKVRHVGYREVDTDTPVDYFPNNTISITKIRSLDSENFPIQESGILETHKLDEDVYAYQRYTSTRNKHIHMRFWDVNAGNWTEWQRENISRYLGLNALTPTDSPLLAHLRYSITHTIINAQGNEGFPENKSGTLINYALTYDNFPFQEYYIYQESKVYKRYWDGGSWSTWRKVQDIVGAQYSFPNLLLTSTPASDFDHGITVAYITGGANDSGLPSGATSGNFITVKETGGQGRTYQEFRQYNTFNKFMRIEQDNGTWSEWRKFVLE